MSDKHTIDLSIDITLMTESKSRSWKPHGTSRTWHGVESVIVMTKIITTNFVPQHGMNIMVDGSLFQVQTIALAGFSGLKHVAHPVSSPNGPNLNTGFFTSNKALFKTECTKYIKNGWSSTTPHRQLQ